MSEKRIFMDHAAGRPVDARVLQAMLPYLGEAYGNPSAAYAEGVAARRALDSARECVAERIGACADEIFFTSGGSESDNWAIRGYEGEGALLTSALEHPAITETARVQARGGREVDFLPITAEGELDMDALAARLARGGCALLTLMHANHETGVIQPVLQATALAHRAGCAVLCDAVQSAVSERIDVRELGVDMLSISGHKLGTPRGIGLLYVRRGTPLSPLITGGGQEMGRRSGTESVAAAVALAEALRLREQGRETYAVHLAQLRTRLLAGLQDIPGCCLNGREKGAGQLCGTVNVSFDCVEGASLVLWLDRHGVCVSAGAACSSAGRRPSAALLAMGRTQEQAMSAVRFSLGEENTAEEVDRTLAAVREGVEKLRSLDIVGAARYCKME